MYLFGLHNRTGAHDPTAIQKCGRTYWIFATGNGISSLYSRDMISWTEGRTPYTREGYPAWINTYVPGFEGHFWAPECVYMNGKYHLYYSCSTWGSKVSCIGLATNETLNPEDPNFLWEDEGVVVHSNSGSDANCIDPSVFMDEGGNYFLTYGSYFGGIRVVELDSTSGKVSGSYRYPVASGNCEASYVIARDGYYYLFINRGNCCQGVNSTYHIQVGRSEVPTGPFIDKSGADMNAGGGSTILSTNGSYIGPGHVGYYVESGVEWVTYHYYDGDRNGAATLAIGTMRWTGEGWPEITNDFIQEGDYVLVNRNSQFVVQAVVPSEPGAAVFQGSYSGGVNQKWRLTPVGNGFYSIGAGDSDLAIETAGCSSVSGALLDLGTDNFMPCVHWKFERTNQLEYVISSRSGNVVVNVPNPAFNEGTQLQTAIYSGIASHYWSVQDTSVMSGYSETEPGQDQGVRIYPNPVAAGSLFVQFDQPSQKVLVIEVFSLEGRLVCRELPGTEGEIEIRHPFERGVYIMMLLTREKVFEERFVVL